MVADLINHRYRVLASLAEGGFGKTFLAEDTQMPSRQRCVIKRLKSASSQPKMAEIVRDRFAREAAVLESVSKGNPQIPDLYAYFSEGDQFYLVQEYIEGTPLHKTIPPVWTEERVNQFLIDALPALARVHQQNVIHRDIKPENIILRAHDQMPCLIDFGAVKEMMNTVVSAEAHENSIVIGTPGFMPPEQAAGRPTFSSDLYSLAMTAIYLLTGRSPHEIPTDSHTGQVLWQQYANGVSDRTATLLTRAISLNPQTRYATATDMLKALAKAPKDSREPVVKTVASERPELPSTKTVARVQPTWKYVGVGVGAVVVGVLAIASIQQQSSELPSDTATESATTEPTNEGDSAEDLSALINSTEDALTANPTNASAKTTLALYYANRAEKLYAEGREALALADIESAIENDPNQTDALILKGDIRVNQSRPDFVEAIAAYTEALNSPEILDSQAAKVFGKRCKAYESQQNWTLAEADCTQSLSLDSDNADIYALRGDIYAAQNNFEKAAEQYDIAIETNQTNGVDDRNIYYRRFKAREKIGDIEGALSDSQYIKTPQ